MKTNKEPYVNASVIIGGAVCALLMANRILGWVSDGDGPTVIPGLGILCGLCFPVLYFWAGMLLRTKMNEPQRWLRILAAGLSIFCLYGYRHFAENWGYADALYISMAAMGFLIPPKTLVSAAQNKGWISFALTVFCAFCYTAISTVKDRLLWGVIVPDHPDMEMMMETVLADAEPLMAVVTIYFIVQFAFSEIAQKLGSQAWFRGTAAIPCIFAFLDYLGRLSTMRWFGVALDYVRYSPLMWFIVQPITIYLVVFLYRLIKERRQKKEERASWKELAKL